MKRTLLSKIPRFNDLTGFSTKPPLIVVLTGRQRAGKDTVADYLKYRHGFYKVALADCVKDVAKQYFGTEFKDRELLIQIGTKMREIDPYVWVYNLMRRIEVQFKLLDIRHFVVSDVRFLNEWEFFTKEMGAWSIRVEADREIRASRSGYTPEHENDPTETEMDNVDTDYVIVNNTDLLDLESQVDRAIEGVLRDAG